MSIIHAKDATIEVSIDGERWHQLNATTVHDVHWDKAAENGSISVATIMENPLPDSIPPAIIEEARQIVRERLLGSIAASAAAGFGICAPFVQMQTAAAAAAEAVEEARRRMAAIGPRWFSIPCRLERFNHRAFEVLMGSHTRRAMRYRKLSHYRRSIGRQKRT